MPFAFIIITLCDGKQQQSYYAFIIYLCCYVLCIICLFMHDASLAMLYVMMFDKEWKYVNIVMTFGIQGHCYNE